MFVICLIGVPKVTTYIYHFLFERSARSSYIYLSQFAIVLIGMQKVATYMSFILSIYVYRKKGSMA